MTRQLIGAEEVAEITGMSKSYSFKLIKTLNTELAAQGIMTIPGRFSARISRHAFSPPLLSRRWR